MAKTENNRTETDDDNGFDILISPNRGLLDNIGLTARQNESSITETLIGNILSVLPVLVSGKQFLSFPIKVFPKAA